uniref:Uncharacterized protein n=1 Tax=Triticum urartu TaxID=4572 RepID=A0A8R7V601_TRIUA
EIYNNARFQVNLDFRKKNKLTTRHQLFADNTGNRFLTGPIEIESSNLLSSDRRVCCGSTFRMSFEGAPISLP